MTISVQKYIFYHKVLLMLITIKYIRDYYSLSRISLINWEKQGLLKPYYTPGGRRRYKREDIEHLLGIKKESPVKPAVVCYARVSTAKQKDYLDNQMQRLKSYCKAKGYRDYHIISEIASGVNENRRELRTLSDYKGNFIRHKTFYCHDLEHCRTGQRDFTINHVVKEMFEWLTTNHTEVVVIERLDFKQDMDTNAWLNRFRSNFTYSKLHKAITRKALRTGMFIKTVNPTYTSQIGTLKYAAQYGMARHEAAAYVIARRGLGYNERIPKRIIQNLPDIISTLIQKASGAKEAAKKKLTAHIKVLKQWKAYSPVSTIHKWKLWSLLYQSLPCPVFPMEGIAGVSGQAAPLTGAGP